MSSHNPTVIGCLFATAIAIYACGEADERNDPGSTQGSAAGGSGGAAASGGAGGNGSLTVGSGGSDGPCIPTETSDSDQDGWTQADGDCNDCDANVSPSAIEVQTDPDDPDAEPVDEDCDDIIDEVIPPCDDGGIALDDFDPVNGARALGICDTAGPDDKAYGLIDAAYVRADGSEVTTPTAQVGILDAFGDNVLPQQGARMVGLSSGHARMPGQPDACNTHECIVSNQGDAPGGFPLKVPGCGMGMTVINDDIGLEITMRAPSNASGYKFAFKFHSFEFPEYVCTNFNDQFIALVSPKPEGSLKGNISFDNNDNPVSVNIAFFDVCDPSSIGNFAQFCTGNCPSAPSPYCPEGADELVNTGFEPSWGQDAGATVWLQSQAPIGGGEEFSIRFTIWDTGDQLWDSSVLVDAFEWIANAGSAAVPVETMPVPK